MKTKPDPALLLALLDYFPDMGLLFWRKRPEWMFQKPAHARSWNAKYAGKQAFTAKDGGGYRCGAINGTRYLAHQVIWAMQTGAWADFEIDHRNGCGSDNRWENLRDATRGQNAKNLGISARNKSGFKGVSWDRFRNKWAAAIRADGRDVFLGRYDTVEAAAAAYSQASQELHGSYRREFPP